MNKLLSFRPVILRIALAGTLCILLMASGARAQDPGHQDPPRTSGAVLGGEPALPDVTFIRGVVLGIGSPDSVRVALDVHMRGAMPDTIVFPSSGLRVDSAMVDGRRVRSVSRPGHTAVPVPARRVTDGSPDGEAAADGISGGVAAAPETRVSLFYVVRSGLNRRTGRDGGVAVWTGPGGIDTGWLPLPSASDDLFHADLIFPLPPAWTLVLPPENNDSNVPDDLRAAMDSSAATDPAKDRAPRPADTDTPRIHVIRPAEALTAHDLGFVAVRADELRTDRGDAGSGPMVLAVGAGILDRPADSVRAELARASDFLTGQLALSVSGDAAAHVLIGGSPGGSAGPGVAIHGDAAAAPAEPWATEFERTSGLLDAVLAPSLTRIPTTDIWLRPAIVAWLSAHHVRSLHGEAAFGDVMEDLRLAYLKDAAARSRPLVWDRWVNAVDLVDAAGSRGAWILHMLASTIGPDAVLSGLDAFLDLSDEHLRDTEALRESLEEYSNTDLSPFFDAWVYGAGHPVLDVTTSHDAARERLSVRIAQVQDGQLVPAAFPMSLGVRFASIAGATETELAIDGPVTERVFEASIAPTYFHLDTHAGWLYEYETPPDDDDIVSMLRDDDTPSSRVRTYRMLARGDADPGLLFGARRVIESETDPVAKSIGLGLPSAMAPAASAERMLLEHANDPSPLVRARVFRGLIGFDGQTVGDAALRAANSDSNPLVLAAAVPVLIDHRPGIGWDVVESALVTASPRHRVRLAALGMIAAVDHPDGERLRALIDHTGEGQPFAIRRTAALVAARAFPASSHVGDLARQWLSSEQALLRLAALDMLAVLPSEAARDLLGYGRSRAAEMDPALDPDPRVRARLDHLRDTADSG